MDEKLIKTLIEKNVLRFGEFKLKSGRISPYFFNSGNIDSGKALSVIGEACADVIVKNKIDFDVIFGPAYKGISLGAAIAKTLYEKYNIEKRFVFDRKEAKEYGDMKDRMIIGNLKENDKILIIDDVVTTGLTKFETIEKLKSLGLNLDFAGLLILFDRQEKMESGKSATEELQKRGLNIFSLLKARDIFEFLRNKEIDGNIYINEEIYKKFQKYFEEYGISNRMH